MKADVKTIIFPVRCEELVTVAIDDTADTFFLTGVARSCCHDSFYAVYYLNNLEIFLSFS